MAGSSEPSASEPAASTEPAYGGCLCGAVRFEGKPPFLFCVHCHCTWCRRAHGAAFVTWLGVKAEAFSILEDRGGGPPAVGSANVASPLTWFASSELSERGFCNRCGTKMLFRSKGAPGEVHIALACVRNANNEEANVPPLAPSSHIFYDAHVSWFEFKDELPKVDRTAKDLAGYNSIAQVPSSS